MGKKGAWFSAIKGVFTSPLDGDKKNKAKRFKLFLFKEPSSIEKILAEVDQHNLYFPQPNPSTTAPPREIIQPLPQPTLQHLSATKIQSAYRRYKSRRNALLRLQGLVNPLNVKRQTVNALKQMQLLVRLQTQIQSRRRIQMLDNQLLKQPTNNHHLEREARLKKKVDAITNRERPMSYAYSHQKAKPESGNEKVIRYPSYPWWWNSLERQLPSSHTQLPLKNHQFASTPSRLTPPATPMSSRSLALPNRIKTTRGGYPMKDDDSFMSCPPFSVPNYMSPTVSTKAKARPTSNPRDRVSSSVSSLSKRRFSFPFTPNSSNKYKSPGSVGDLRVNSVPASFGRKPFNRFV